MATGRGSGWELAQTKLGRFELEAVLGKGGMGVVHAASLGDQVSLPVALAPSMTLRLGPTSTVEGDVALGNEPFSRDPSRTRGSGCRWLATY